jgi:2-polyprenyl-3-methyl-5-hydroxy-6-metoxy-1,4-benzoquinol methylase
MNKHKLVYEHDFNQNIQSPGDTCHCWICGSKQLKLVKKSNISNELNPSSFAITDSGYGITGDLYRCLNCGFVQCSSLNEVINYYEDLQDQEYEESRSERVVQAQKLLKKLQVYKQQGRLLDIGAGSGILLEQAQKLGYQSEGVEPSRWLRNQAKKRGLQVHLGTFPHENIQQGVDLVTLIDVIEHVSNPVELLVGISDCMDDKGIGLIVTPDLDSIAARLLGWKWWHYRIAHIGYFNKQTLEKALNLSGLEVVKWGRPVWYFSISYLLKRASEYLPRPIRMSGSIYLDKITVPLNLRDSIYIIFKKSR